MKLVSRLKAIPAGQKYRYALIIVSCALFFAPFAFLPGLVGNSDFCGEVCMRRFFLYFPGMSLADLRNQISVAWIGVIALALILLTTFFWGRLWCAYLCPVGGFPELVSRTLDDRWKIEYRALPQVPIRYGYFAVYLLLMPAAGVSACMLCNFITVPRLFEAFSGEVLGLTFIFSSIGLVNLALLFLLGFFASKGRAYCQFLCPIGAIDGLVNRLGATFKFTRRIRVERSRCTGCNICARNCMTGAIKMVDRIAVVDQFSCMSCHECVDVCDWGAIDWLAVPPKNDDPKRKKKGIEFHPQPVWEAIHPVKPKGRGLKAIKWGRVMLTVVLLFGLLFVGVTQVYAGKRQSDPDGCLSCHGLAGLDYIDGAGVRRSASIDVGHYYGSLHGSVPCTDCHRKIRDYPHDPKNGEVDCSASCHVEEPSEGQPYTHEAVAKEFAGSVHGDGRSKGFTGANRLAESEQDQAPSCRLCHSNTPYIDEARLPAFKEAFAHTETECGTCHQGDVWLNQFGGHILRRFIGGRWDKRGMNAVCERCHADRERMAEVRRKDRETGKETLPGARFILASASYAMTLHGKLLARGSEKGAACLDCHASKTASHAILPADDPDSTLHERHLAETCGQPACHGFSEHPLNATFLSTDMHDLDLLPVDEVLAGAGNAPLDSPWAKALALLAPLVIVPAIGMLYQAIFGEKAKGVVFSRFGGGLFQEKMIGRKPKNKVNKKRRTRTQGKPS
ncbi:MAG TPA: 4Fe-4S binding protein [Thiotrichales bacterium]|nr:4Fe-4S binding protein [Thiotrichales bacterium]